MRHQDIGATVADAVALQAYQGEVVDHQRRTENRRQKRARLARLRKAMNSGAGRRVKP